MSTALAASLARRNIHYGWVVVATTFLTMLVTAAAMGTPGALIVPLEHEFGWQRWRRFLRRWRCAFCSTDYLGRSPPHS